MKKLHTYTRILLSLLLMLVTNVVMGQEYDNLYSVPFSSISSEGAQTIYGSSVDNLKDKNKGSVWWAERDMINLNYLQIENPDNTNDGKRSWIEIPYVPNQNTQVEVVIQAKNANVNDWKTEYVFGSGPLDGAGMSFGLAHTSARTQENAFKNMYLYGVSTQRFEKVVDEFDTENKQTIICTPSFMSVDNANATQNNSASFYAGDKKLCFFYNPYVDWNGARCFEGKIYSVKIRENGNVLYDLTPVKVVVDGGDYRYGFLDKNSEQFYGFLEMGDYIENKFVSGESNDAKDRLHIQIPYSSTATSTLESSNRIKALTAAQTGFNGTSFETYSNANNQKIELVEGSYVLSLEKGDLTGNPWECQLLANFTSSFQPGERYYISFSYKADVAANVNVYAQGTNGLQVGGGGDSNFLKDFAMTTEWKKGEWTGIVPNNFSSEAMTRLAFHLNTEGKENKFYFKDFEVRKIISNLLNNGDFSTDDLGSFAKQDKSKDYPVTMTRVLDGEKNSYVLQVVCNGPGGGNKGGNKYDSQLFLKLNEKMHAGDRYYVSYDYKYNADWTIETQAQSQQSSYSAMLPINPTFQQGTWKSGEWYGTITEDQAKNGGMSVIALCLYNTDGYTGTYQFDNFVVTRVPAPQMELELDFENTYDNFDYSSERYLFSMDNGSFDSRAMSLNVIKDEVGRGNFMYKSGTSTINTGIPARSASILNKRLTYKFSPENVTIGTQSFWLSGTPELSTVNMLSLMGAHSTDNPVKSVRGKLYGAKIRENGVVKKDLRPARNGKGQWGLYDVIGKQFYSKCTTSHASGADFTGPKQDLCKGSAESSAQNPIIVDFTTEHPISPKQFVITTPSRDNNINDTWNNPKKWTLKASNDGVNWVTLNLAAPKLSQLSTTSSTNLTYWLTDRNVDVNFEDYQAVGANKDYPGWSGSGFGTGSGTAGPVGERWNQSAGFDTYVEITGLPAGNYTFSCDGAYRLGGSESGNEAYIYATTSSGTEQTVFHEISSGRMTADELSTWGIDTGGCRSSVENEITYYTPNQLEKADKWIRIAGKYKNNSVSFNVGSDGKVRLGVKRKGAANDWCFVDNFKLYGNGIYDDNATYYLYNAETGTFVLGGNEWNTRASLSPDGGNKFIVTKTTETHYKLDNWTKAWKNGENVTDWMALYSPNEEVWMDRYPGENRANWDNWVITEVAKNEYELTVDASGKNGKLGTAVDALNGLTDTRLYYSNSAKNTKWSFIKKSDYEAYLAALTNGTASVDLTEPLPCDTRNIFMVTGNTQTYSMYRLEVETLGYGQGIHLADLELMVDCGFEHYEGRVYDESLHKNDEIPLNLRVGGTSGYKSMWKKIDPTDDSFTIQRTHEYEHIVYVLPANGKTIDLLPFADFELRGDWQSGNNYQDQYVRWYDYHTDMLSPRLSFNTINCQSVTAMEKGHLAWRLQHANNHDVRTQEGSRAIYSVPTDTQNKEVLDTIAIEASIDFNSNIVWNGSQYVVKEPTLQWRHTFVIMDARVRADEMTTNNTNYIAENKITLMCPAGTPFQYPLPCYEYSDYSDKDHPTDYYYKEGDAYKSVSHYRIETWQNGSLKGTTTCSETATIEDASTLQNEWAYSYKKLDGYNRVFYMKKPQVGTYTIKIYADVNGVKGIQIMEYELQVLSAEKASMVEGNVLYGQENGNPTYSYQLQIPENMSEAYGKPTTQIDFDDATEVTNDGEHHYLSWPWQWENSSYGFGYTKRGDYNMYMVTDHSTVTPYKGEDHEDIYDVSYNDYKRKNGTAPTTPGYFFYANAASDPGRMAVLDIGKDFCKNTKVYVSAWINEFQGLHTKMQDGKPVVENNKNVMEDPYAESANVVFSFRGVDKNGKETILNSYVTGYVPGGWNTTDGYLPNSFTNRTKYPDKRGHWMHVYYTFTTSDDTYYDHYIITMENNCTSSVGADYAIDDIRCYVRKPKLEGRLMEPVCDGSTETEMELRGDFDLLYDAFALQSETNDNITLKYLFLDQEVYEESLEQSYQMLCMQNSSFKTKYSSVQDWRIKVRETDNAADMPTFTSAYEKAFNAAKLSHAYGMTNDTYNEIGVLNFYKTYDLNTDYPNPYTDNLQHNHGYKYQYEASGVKVKNIYFPCQTTDAQIKAGKTYIIAFKKSSDSSIPSATDFDIASPCNNASEFSIPLPARIKIDGKLQSNMSGMSYCANQRPKVELDLNGIKKGGDPVVKGEVMFDWYYGPKNLGEEQIAQGYTRAYMEEKRGEISLQTAIEHFRQLNPEVEEDVVRKAKQDPENTTGITFREEGDGKFTKEMLWYIKDMLEEGRISLYKDNAYASAHMYGENLYPANQKEFYISAIPIDPDPDNHDVSFCLDAINVVLKVSEFTPTMRDGDSKVAIYPATLQDVPLRIGLKQLKRAVVANLSSNTIENLESASHENQLWMPVRAINTVTNGAVNLKLAEDFMIYIVDSNDPKVKSGEAGAIPVEEAVAPLKGAVISGKSYVAGKVLAIQATKGGTENACQLAFLKDFQFREGYYYTMKFHFREVFTDGLKHEEVCPGDLIFTIKVVPEYQMWTGAVSRNWNDDRNWRRVTKEDLLWKLNDVDVKTTEFLTANADYIVDGGTNDNVKSFAPADFTKVIIPADAPRVPYMYNLRGDANKTSIQFTGAPKATDQLATAIPANLTEINDPDVYAATLRTEELDLDGKIFVITDNTGQNTLGVSRNNQSPQDAVTIAKENYSQDKHVYARFAKVEKEGVAGKTYTIQLCKSDGINYSLWGYQGYLNFQANKGNTIFALGLSVGDIYGQDGENLGLWRVVQNGDGVTIQNVGDNRYLNPSASTPSSEAVICKLATSFSTRGASGIGLVTSLVQYDMASVEKSTTKDGDVACRPWYDHTCDQIHFNSGAAMMDQRYLYYNKAWCDIEVPVGTWQTVASPLMNIVAGDLYLPTASARQDTPLFEDINYQESLNDRFAPAVFQRSWNKSMAKVYELGGDQPRNVGIKLDWSHVYNDVNVRYGAGTGFSIKVDVSSDLVTNKPATAKFRFPKADTHYTYYNPGNTDGSSDVGPGKKEPVNGNDAPNGVRPGKLSDLTSGSILPVGDNTGDNQNPATPTQYFLVGNPLMCWLDMNAFFEGNKQFEPKYWTVTADGQQTALFSEERGWVSTSEDPKFLPPGVSFFVHLKQNQDGQAGASTTVAPDFKSSMMSYTQAEPRTNDPAAGGNNNNNQQNNEDGSSNNAKTRSANSTMPQLHMTATDVNGRQSRALLMDGTMIEHEGVETLFDSNLKDDALLYTTKDGMAKTIASIAPGDTLPLAVSGARDEVQLSIEGVKDFDFDLFLIDSEEGTVTPLEGDVVLKQDASGVRYYIATRSANDTEMEGDVNVPRVVSKDGYITVYAPATCEIETSAIYNTGGIRMDFAEHILDSHSVKLYPGVYIVKLLADGRTYSYKLLVR